MVVEKMRCTYVISHTSTHLITPVIHIFFSWRVFIAFARPYSIHQTSQQQVFWSSSTSSTPPGPPPSSTTSLRRPCLRLAAPRPAALQLRLRGRRLRAWLRIWIPSLQLLTPALRSWLRERRELLLRPRATRSPVYYDRCGPCFVEEANGCALDAGAAADSRLGPRRARLAEHGRHVKL